MPDLLLFAKHLFVAAMLAVPFGTGAADRFNNQRRSNDATVNPHGGSCDERAIADT
jgi:hypothetical protein